MKISYNGEVIPVKNFQQYIDLYIGTKDDAKRVYENPDDRWEYAVALSPAHEFTQISFVNGIATSKGGKHVDYIMGQITRKLCDYIEKRRRLRSTQRRLKNNSFCSCDAILKTPHSIVKLRIL